MGVTLVHFHTEYYGFLLPTCNVPNERGVYDISARKMNIDDRRPTSGPTHTLWKNSNGHSSAMHHLISFMFGSRVWFWGMVDQMVPFRLDQIQDDSRP